MPERYLKELKSLSACFYYVSRRKPRDVACGTPRESMYSLDPQPRTLHPTHLEFPMIPR